MYNLPGRLEYRLLPRRFLPRSHQARPQMVCRHPVSDRYDIRVLVRNSPALFSPDIMRRQLISVRTDGSRPSSYSPMTSTATIAIIIYGVDVPLVVGSGRPRRLLSSLCEQKLPLDSLLTGCWLLTMFEQSFFTLVAACLEIYMLYSARDSDTGDGLPRHSEKRLSGYSAATSEGTNAAAAGAPAATNGTGSTTNPAPGTGVGTSYRADPEAGGTGTGYGTGTGTGQGYGTAAGTTEGNTTGGTTGAAHNVV